MTTLTHTIRRLTVMLGLLGVSLAIVAPAALANHENVGTKAALEQIQAVHAAQWPGALQPRRAHVADDTTDGVDRYLRNNPRHVVVGASDALSRYLRNTGTPGSSSTSEVSRPSIQVPLAQPKAFDWRDAGIGAGSAVALMLIALGGLLIGLRRRPSGTTMVSS